MKQGMRGYSIFWVVLMFAALMTPSVFAQAVAGKGQFNVIISVSLKDLRAAAAKSDPEWEKKLGASLSQFGPRAQDVVKTLKEKAGLDVIRDFDSIFAGIGLTESKGATPNVVLVAAGKHDAARVVPVLAELSSSQGMPLAKLADYNGAAVLSGKNPSGGEEVFIAFTGTSAVISTKEALLRKTIDSFKSGHSLLTGDAEMIELARQANPSAMLSVYGTIPAKLIASGANPQKSEGPLGLPEDAVKTFMAHLDVKQGFDLSVNLGCKDATTAMALKSMIEGVRGMVGMSLAQSDGSGGISKDATAKMNQALQKITLAATNNKMTVSLKLTEAEMTELEKAMKESAAGLQNQILGAMMGGMPGGGAPGGAPDMNAPAGAAGMGKQNGATGPKPPHGNAAQRTRSGKAAEKARTGNTQVTRQGI